MKQIYLISKEGPEWSIPIEAWDDKTKANARAKVLDKMLNKRGLDGLSPHVVQSITFRQEPKP